MRMHILLDDDLARRIDAFVGPRGRSRFVVDAVRRRLDDERRWEALFSAAGAIPDEGHDWDDDPAAWVAKQRRADASRVG